MIMHFVSSCKTTACDPKTARLSLHIAGFMGYSAALAMDMDIL